jgi:hypothetical protein
MCIKLSQITVSVVIVPSSDIIRKRNNGIFLQSYSEMQVELVSRQVTKTFNL